MDNQANVYGNNNIILQNINNSTITIYQNPQTGLRIPFMAPLLLKHFVKRDEIYNKLFDSLLETNHQNPIAITTALHGAGGYGKTTLAAALCHDPNIQETFNEGILWVTLGIKPNLLESLSTLYFALTGERPGFKDINQATENLTLTLAERHCLMVIDDVWEYSDLVPFLRGGSNCTRLFTTRNFKLACEGSRRIEVDQMTHDESIELILGKKITQEVERQLFYDLVNRLCHWPLLLELAGKFLHYRLKCGEKLTDAVWYLNRTYTDKGIIAFDSRNSDERNQAVARTIRVSLDLLSATEQKYYLKLAVFPEDIDIPFTTLNQLWNLTVDKIEELLQTLNNLALLNLNLNNRTIRLHDELRLYLISQSKDLVTSHKKLLTIWGDFYLLPDEFAWQNLAYHLIGSQQTKKLRKLLLDPDWLELKLRYIGIAGLLNDFDYLPKDRDLRYIQRAIQLSAHVINRDFYQLPSQLYGRLLGIKSKPIQNMLRKIKNKKSIWLRSINTFLSSPDSPLIYTLVGHFDLVNGVTITPDGRRAVSASGDATLKVWDLETGQELRTLTENDSFVWVNGVVVTQDGRRAVSASGDATIKVWDLETGQELRALTGHSLWVNGVAITPDGHQVISASIDKTLKVWDLETGQELYTFAGHVDQVNGVVVVPGGRLVVSASNDKTVKVWDLETGQELHTLIGHSDSVNGIAVTSDGKLAISASADKTLKIWELKTGKELRTLNGHSGSVCGVAISPNGCRAVSASEDKTLKVWELKTGKELRTLNGHSGSVYGVAISPNGCHAVSASEDKTLKVWDLETNQEPYMSIGHFSSITDVAVTPNGKLAVSASSSDKTLKVWDLKTGQVLHTLTGHLSSVYGVSITPDGLRAISASKDKTLKIWELKDGQELRMLTGHLNSVFDVKVTSDGLRAISASDDKTIKVWDLETGCEIRTLTGHSESIYEIVITPDGYRVISASYDKTLKVWDLETGQILHTLKHSGFAKGISVLPDGHQVILADVNEIKVCDLKNGNFETIFYTNYIISHFSVTPDGNRAVIIDSNTLNIRDLKLGFLGLQIFTGDYSFNCCAVANDSKTIVAGNELGQLCVLYCEGIKFTRKA